MANEEQLAIFKQGVGVWNGWRQNNPDAVIDLSGADLSATHLSGANLNRAYLIGANLSGANLSGADLTDCRIYNIHAGNVTLVGAIQKNLIITEFGRPTLTVQRLQENVIVI